MAETFKNLLGQQAIAAMAEHLARVDEAFDDEGFVCFATDGLDELALKERSSRIADALGRFLPDDYAQAVKVLVASLEPDTGLSVGV